MKGVPSFFESTIVFEYAFWLKRDQKTVVIGDMRKWKLGRKGSGTCDDERKEKRERGSDENGKAKKQGAGVASCVFCLFVCSFGLCTLYRVGGSLIGNFKPIFVLFGDPSLKFLNLLPCSLGSSR